MNVNSSIAFTESYEKSKKEFYDRDRIEAKASEQKVGLAKMAEQAQDSEVWSRQQMWYIKQLITFAEDARRDIEELRRNFEEFKMERRNSDG